MCAGQGWGGHSGWAAVPESILGKEILSNSFFSSTAEKDLLNQLSVPAHFVGLDGNSLNVRLKTGSEVRLSGQEAGQEWWWGAAP